MMETIGGIEISRTIATTDAFLSMIVEVKACIRVTCINNITRSDTITIVLLVVTTTHDTVIVGVKTGAETTGIRPKNILMVIHRTISLEIRIGHQAVVLIYKRSIGTNEVDMLDIHLIETMTTDLGAMPDQRIHTKVMMKQVLDSARVKGTMSDQVILMTEVAMAHQSIDGANANEGTVVTKATNVRDTSTATNTRSENAIVPKSAINEAAVTAVSRLMLTNLYAPECK
jgi:hypothetical protein